MVYSIIPKFPVFLGQYVPSHIIELNIQFPIFDRYHKKNLCQNENSKDQIEDLVFFSFANRKVTLLMNDKVLNYFLGSSKYFCQVKVLVIFADFKL